MRQRMPISSSPLEPAIRGDLCSCWASDGPRPGLSRVSAHWKPQERFAHGFSLDRDRSQRLQILEQVFLFGGLQRGAEQVPAIAVRALRGVVPRADSLRLGALRNEADVLWVVQVVA